MFSSAASRFVSRSIVEYEVVMYDGEIVQIGTPAELFDRPSHTFVGSFIGSPGMNVLPVKMDGTDAIIGDVKMPLAKGAAVPAGAKIELGIRPEFVRLGREGMPVTIEKVVSNPLYQLAASTTNALSGVLHVGQPFNPAGVPVKAEASTYVE